VGVGVFELFDPPNSAFAYKSFGTTNGTGNGVKCLWKLSRVKQAPFVTLVLLNLRKLFSHLKTTPNLHVNIEVAKKLKT